MCICRFVLEYYKQFAKHAIFHGTRGLVLAPLSVIAVYYGIKFITLL